MARPDAKHEALLGLTGKASGATDDLEREWLLGKITGEIVSYHINDLYMQYFLETGVTDLEYNDAQYAFLLLQGIDPAALPEMWDEFWRAQGGIQVPPNAVVFNGDPVTYMGDFVVYTP